MFLSETGYIYVSNISEYPENLFQGFFIIISVLAIVGTAVTVTVNLFYQRAKLSIVFKRYKYTPFITVEHSFQNNLFFHNSEKIS
jgi:hypothetical protein